MLEDGGRVENILQAGKRLLTRVIKHKSGVFLYQVSQGGNNIRETHYKASIEVSEANKGSHVSNILRSFLVFHYSDLYRVYAYSFRGYNKSKV